MSVRLSKITYNEHGDPRVTITIEGSHDLYRLAHHLECGQVEFYAVGSAIKRRMRRRAGKAKWEGLQRYFHGRTL